MSVSRASQDREFYDAGDPELNIVRDTGTGEMYRKRPKEGGTHGRTSSFSIQRRDGAHWCRPRKGKKRTRSPKDRLTSSVIDPDGTETPQPAETVDVATIPVVAAPDVVRDDHQSGAQIDEQANQTPEGDVMEPRDEVIDDKCTENVAQERDSQGDDEEEGEGEGDAEGEILPNELDDEGSSDGEKELNDVLGVEERSSIMNTPSRESLAPRPAVYC